MHKQQACLPPHCFLRSPPEAPQDPLPSGQHTLVDQVGWRVSGDSHFGGHFCFIAGWQVVQNGTGVFGRAQPQVHVDFRLHRPASWPFARKLRRVTRKPTSLERADYGPCSLRNVVLPGYVGTHPGGIQRAVLRSSSCSKMRPTTPAATVHSPGGGFSLRGA